MNRQDEVTVTYQPVVLREKRRVVLQQPVESLIYSLICVKRIRYSFRYIDSHFTGLMKTNQIQLVMSFQHVRPPSIL